MLSETEIETLTATAKSAREKAIVFKSKLAWGASVLTADGKVFGGCNIDGIMSDEGICAERAAINHAVVHGYYHLKAVCLFGENLGVPCGRCLQYGMMFCDVTGEDIPIVMAEASGKYEISSVKQLLPKAYETRVFREALQSYKDKPGEWGE